MGILFLDRINRKNNLWYCETITTSNPCAEQPLPPYGACLLGSFNLTKYIKNDLKVSRYITQWKETFDYEQLAKDIPVVVRAMDNVVDRAIYPLPEQKLEAENKRRMGLGVTGVANAIECLGFPYGSKQFRATLADIMEVIRDGAYQASIELAKEKGPFPLFDTRLLESEFAKTLPENIREDIRSYGLRNSHLLSVAPTGTISLSADNVSSGIEPVFSYSYDRTINTPDGVIVEKVVDYGLREWGVRGSTADALNVMDHVEVLNLASKYVDSACSKTCNVGAEVSWEDFKDVYMRAYEGGASGCTTFRAAGKRYGILNASSMEDIAPVEETSDEFISERDFNGQACYYDVVTGQKECS